MSVPGILGMILGIAIAIFIPVMWAITIANGIEDKLTSCDVNKEKK